MTPHINETYHLLLFVFELLGEVVSLTLQSLRLALVHGAAESATIHRHGLAYVHLIIFPLIYFIFIKEQLI